ncbi:MAG: hypothetical protein PHU63_02610 [Candidatus ainarchaeum sp.]|nr:hypothetical protein [Candidatus ainarchaeum sp.]
MSSCPDCHIYKGLWSELKENKNGEWVCTNNSLHAYTKDEKGYFKKKK